MLPGVRNWELVIVVAIAVSVRTIEEAFGGGVSAPAAIVRFVLAGFVSWAAVALIERMWSSYSQAARQRQLAAYISRRAELAQSLADPSASPPSNNPPG